MESNVATRFRSGVRRWYGLNGRHELPWRLTRDPYAILVSEVMLQQTQVERVIPYYESWVLRWPTFAALAAADSADVIRAWSGLGYNRRALNLHRAAVLVGAAGGLPRSLPGLRGFPGVGPYTASAVLSFAFEQGRAGRRYKHRARARAERSRAVYGWRRFGVRRRHGRRGTRPGRWKAGTGSQSRPDGPRGGGLHGPCARL